MPFTDVTLGLTDKVPTAGVKSSLDPEDDDDQPLSKHYSSALKSARRTGHKASKAGVGRKKKRDRLEEFKIYVENEEKEAERKRMAARMVLLEAKAELYGHEHALLPSRVTSSTIDGKYHTVVHGWMQESEMEPEWGVFFPFCTLTPMGYTEWDVKRFQPGDRHWIARLVGPDRAWKKQVCVGKNPFGTYERPNAQWEMRRRIDLLIDYQEEEEDETWEDVNGESVNPWTFDANDFAAKGVVRNPSLKTFLENITPQPDREIQVRSSDWKTIPRADRDAIGRSWTVYVSDDCLSGNHSTEIIDPEKEEWQLRH